MLILFLILYGIFSVWFYLSSFEAFIISIIVFICISFPLVVLAIINKNRQMVFVFLVLNIIILSIGSLFVIILILFFILSSYYSYLLVSYFVSNVLALAFAVVYFVDFKPKYYLRKQKTVQQYVVINSI